MSGKTAIVADMGTVTMNCSPALVESILNTVIASLETVQDSPHYVGNAVRLGYAIESLRFAAEFAGKAADATERGSSNKD